MRFHFKICANEEWLTVQTRFFSVKAKENGKIWQNITLGGGGLPYEMEWDARQKIRIIPLKETNLSMTQALFVCLRRPC